jgi:hypothetical protein
MLTSATALNSTAMAGECDTATIPEKRMRPNGTAPTSGVSTPNTLRGSRKKMKVTMSVSKTLRLQSLAQKRSIRCVFVCIQLLGAQPFACG